MSYELQTVSLRNLMVKTPAPADSLELFLFVKKNFILNFDNSILKQLFMDFLKLK